MTNSVMLERHALAPVAASPPTIRPELFEPLLDLARAALAVAVGQAERNRIDLALERAKAAGEPGAVFVTLTEDGALRGCIGLPEPVLPLREAVVAATVDAALSDPRFRPVTALELPAIHIDISLIGRPEPMVGVDRFEPGVDGVVVERDGRRALLLPEVATEFAWGASEMLGAVCEKADLPAWAWRDRGTRLSTFRTIRFGGPALPVGSPTG